MYSERERTSEEVSRPSGDSTSRRDNDRYNKSHGDRWRRRSWSGSRSRSRSRSNSDSYGRDRKRKRDYDDSYKRHDDRYRHHDGDRGRNHSRRDRDRGRNRDYDHDYSSRARRESPNALFDGFERAQKSVCCRQLASRLKDRELAAFFESHNCPVQDASIVKDKRSNRSKGIAYVEFKDLESVSKAVALTGEKLLGIPIVVEITDAEKNRQALQNAGLAPPMPKSKEHQVRVGNLDRSVTEDEFREAFEKFGTVLEAFIYKTPSGKTKDYGVINFASIESAEQAKLEMEGHPLKGRPLSIFNADVDTKKLSTRLNTSSDRLENSHHENAAVRTHEKEHAPKSVSRTELMHRLMRDEDRIAMNITSENENENKNKNKSEREHTAPKAAPHIIASPCVVIHNMFDPEEESGTEWIKELEEDVKLECEESYGKVMHIALDPASNGDVYVKFEDSDTASKAVSELNGRWFAGKQLEAESMVEMVYHLKYPNAAAA